MKIGKGGSESPAGSRRAWNLHLNWIHKTPPPRWRYLHTRLLHRQQPALCYCFGKNTKIRFPKTQPWKIHFKNLPVLGPLYFHCSPRSSLYSTSCWCVLLRFSFAWKNCKECSSLCCTINAENGKNLLHTADFVLNYSLLLYTSSVLLNITVGRLCVLKLQSRNPPFIMKIPASWLEAFLWWANSFLCVF